MKRLVLLVSLALAGCASSSGVVRLGSDQFFISKQAATGFTGMSALRAEALQEAYAECSKYGKSVDVVSTDEAQPPYILGNYPRVDITFRCVIEVPG